MIILRVKQERCLKEKETKQKETAWIVSKRLNISQDE
jgi:hypothetical protein